MSGLEIFLVCGARRWVREGQHTGIEGQRTRGGGSAQACASLTPQATCEMLLLTYLFTDLLTYLINGLIKSSGACLPHNLLYVPHILPHTPKP